MKFTKMQGTGNDSVYVNYFEETVEDPQQTAIREPTAISVSVPTD